MVGCTAGTLEEGCNVGDISSPLELIVESQAKLWMTHCVARNHGSHRLEYKIEVFK